MYYTFDHWHNEADRRLNAKIARLDNKPVICARVKKAMRLWGNIPLIVIFGAGWMVNLGFALGTNNVVWIIATIAAITVPEVILACLLAFNVWSAPRLRRRLRCGDFGDAVMFEESYEWGVLDHALKSLGRGSVAEARKRCGVEVTLAMCLLLTHTSLARRLIYNGGLVEINGWPGTTVRRAAWQAAQTIADHAMHQPATK